MVKRIFWAGDSTVKHNRINSYPQTGIGQVMNLYLKPEIEIHNYAENGRSTKSFIDEGRLKLIEEALQEGDILLIQFGHNDQKDEEARYTEPFGTYQENLKKFIKVAREKNAFPVLITPLYRRFFDEEGKLEEHVHMEYPKAMLEVAKKYEVSCIDLCESSRQLLITTGDIASRKWFMHLQPNEFSNYPEGLLDNTHLRHEGAVVMAGLVAEGFKMLGGIYEELLLD
jgi:lysophospholipase L1-like esterase